MSKRFPLNPIKRKMTEIYIDAFFLVDGNNKNKHPYELYYYIKYHSRYTLYCSGVVTAEGTKGALAPPQPPLKINF